ncbi:unnamed protein product [Acanthoscelides obtectus]|uniref:Peptidase metallopeptidase domain-containing protein n=1 Tax=Acanthoscelides obtectus TaxID=200917 RepID=A0A9P0M6V7_ACAOB|nr:unnamed protein product [Acanthoscelides obtectus]CAK1620551.1 Matrix metalloproteinase-17 [Acanthoscelides obtectus]
MIFFCGIITIVLVICDVDCAPLITTPKAKYPQVPSHQVLDFMKTFGYIDDPKDTEAIYTEEGFTNIIKNVQQFGALNQTGVLDEATLKLMSSPRCGVPDILKPKKSKRRKRYVLTNGWEKRNISYFLANWTPKLGETTIMKNIQKALDTWGGYGRLNFHRAYDANADIIVAFGRGYHGDSFPFDGPGSVLAHAFFPYEFSELGGDIHFDEDEKWIDERNNNGEYGTDFYTVALHELGHSLGLAHSPIPTSVMFPYYKGSEEGSTATLGYDDILAMYKLYISRTLKEDESTRPTFDYDDSSGETSSTTQRTTTQYITTTRTRRPYSTDRPGYTTQNPWRTSEPKVTTKRFVTQKTEYTTQSPWRTTSRSCYTTRATTEHTTPVTYAPDPSSTGAPTRWAGSATVTYEGDSETVDDHKDHDDRHGVPKTNSPSLPNICDGKVDAMATLREELFVFKEQYIWRFKDKGLLLQGYPTTLKRMFPDIPNHIKNIDAAYQRPDGMIILFTEKTYFYKNDRFWRYNETSKRMDPGYPLHMERWRGVPLDLDAAITWTDGYTYFFKDDSFWKFDNDWVITTEESPMPTAQVWFGCPREGSKTTRR